MSATDDAGALARLAADLMAEPDHGVTARTVVDRLLELVPDAEQVAVAVLRRGASSTVAATGEAATAAEDLERALKEGPGVDAIDRQTWTRSGDVACDRRWPRWGPSAGRLGIRSVLSVPLLDHDRSIGTLTAYSSSPARFADRDAVDLALVYSVHATNALTAARRATDLTTAISSRHTIGMAQGIVMERFGLDQDRSFELLRRISSTQQTKLRDVAAHVVAHRGLPDGPATSARTSSSLGHASSASPSTP